MIGMLGGRSEPKRRKRHRAHREFLGRARQYSFGEFTLDVGSLRLDYALSPTMSLRTLTQYNSSTEQWSTSARFRYIHSPGSDLYVVYDGLQGSLPGCSPSSSTAAPARRRRA